MLILKIIAAWFALSIPCALLIARMFAKHIEQLDEGDEVEYFNRKGGGDW